jgi:hypothetical protein
MTAAALEINPKMTAATANSGCRTAPAATLHVIIA